MATTLSRQNTCATCHEGQPVVPVANDRTKKPGGVSRRRESTVGSSFAMTRSGCVVHPRLCTIKRDTWSSGFSPVQCSIATGLLSHPPGSEGSASRPERMKVLCSPPAKATHRFCKSTCGGFVFDASWPTVPLILDVGDWTVTVPLNPNRDDASTMLVGSFKNSGVVIWILPPFPCSELARI